MLSCFLDLCRIFFNCCGDDEKQERSSSYGAGYSSLPQRESSPKTSPAAPEAYTLYTSTYSWKPSSPPRSKPSSSPSFSSPYPAKPQLKPSSSSLVSSKAYHSSSSSSFSSSLTPSLTASFASSSPAKPQSSRLSEPYSSPSRLSSKASSSSSSSLTPSSTASSASRSPVKARSPHAASGSGSPARAWPLAEPSSPSSVSSKASSSSSSSVPPLTASFASPQFEQRNKIGQLPRYEIPKHLQEQIKNDAVPQVLKRPLSPSTYADYFAALLYAEDYYCQKWSDFLLLDVTLELRARDSFKIQNSAGGNKNNKSKAQKDMPFVAFEIGSVPEKRPYLLSRDHVLLRPAGKKTEPFQGILFRVERNKWVLAEFADDFHKQHSPSKKYDVSFSFNRVCLKRSHQAVSAAMDPFLCSILFPDPPRNPFLGPIRSSDFTTQNDRTIIGRILRLKSPQPYLLEGPLSQGMEKLIQIAILQLYETCSNSRILVCAPRNRTLDALTKSLLKDIPESRMFRANAAFRDYGVVPDDIMPACLFEGECFTCPPLAQLKSFRVVTSTFISSYRLYAAGIGADHFTHIFLVDASYATEPETIVAFANLVGKTTAIVATGSAQESPAWVRSDIGRRNGLKKSFFRRLLEMEPYSLRDPMYIAHI